MEEADRPSAHLFWLCCSIQNEKQSQGSLSDSLAFLPHFVYIVFVLVLLFKGVGGFSCQRLPVVSAHYFIFSNYFI